MFLYDKDLVAWNALSPSGRLVVKVFLVLGALSTVVLLWI
jgi:hypothetical protein